MAGHTLSSTKKVLHSLKTEEQMFKALRRSSGSALQAPWSQRRTPGIAPRK